MDYQLDVNDLPKLKELTERVAGTSSSNEKKEILAQYPELKGFLWWAYNPFMKFNITSKAIDKYSDGNTISPNSAEEWTLNEILMALVSRNISGHDALYRVAQYRRYQVPDGCQEVFNNLLDKDLKMRAKTSLINKVFKGLIPEFKVALANHYKDHKNKVDFEKDTWFVSRKLDGIRVITFFNEDGTIQFFSRKGHEFFTLDVLKQELQGKFSPGTVLDGELCIIDEEGNEDFQKALSYMRRKDYTIENPHYKVFDYLTKDVFLGKEKGKVFSVRMFDLHCDLEGLDFNNHLSVLEQDVVLDESVITDLQQQVAKNGWEGLMLRKEDLYKGKRSNDLLKIKGYHEAEYEVIGCSSGPFRIVENGADKTIETLSNVTILHKGYPVDVGSGFSIDQRNYYHEHPDEIIGCQITVQYFEETTNKEGKLSLRFPVVKSIWEQERNM